MLSFKASPHAATRSPSTSKPGTAEPMASGTHKVRPFCGGGAASCDRDAAPAQARGSFVLEQYRLPPEKLARSPSFVVAPSKREQSAIPVVASLRPFGPALVELYLALRRRWLSPRHAPPR